MKKIAIFRNIVCNLALVVIIGTVFVFALYSPVQSVFKTETNSPIYAGNTKSNKVCLMINVYWGTEYLSPMLKILNDANVKTTFFVGGCWVADNTETFKNIVNAGHEIGNHGYFHKEGNKLTESRNFEEINVCHKLVAEVSGIEMNLFAPPGGAYNQSTLNAAFKLGYKTIMWSKDTIDWRDKNADIIFQRATNVKGGDLVLMHPTEKTLQALPNIVSTLQSKGFKLTTVSDCLI